MKQNLLIGLAVALIVALGIASWSVLQVRNAVETNTREIQRQAQEAEARRQAALARDREEAQARQADLDGARKMFGHLMGADGPEQSPTPTPEKQKQP
jgi:uncharacterized protein HemX